QPTSVSAKNKSTIFRERQNINPHEEISKFFRGDFRFSSEEQKNSSDLSFHSSEVSFDSSEEISLASVENFLFPASYWKFPPQKRNIPQRDLFRTLFYPMSA
ncbi:hypothetical protein, partial [uncultured Porphyromonas sp.]|uniref:hypothetical protein n=1 Tax=uncultured Porphyromonas sp. TaxID=159274 RepID=UPI0026248EC5